MEKLEKVELVREKCGVSYEEAREALEATNYDVLDAIVKLEKEGKANTQTATYATPDTKTATVSAEMAEAQNEYAKQTKRTSAYRMFHAFFVQLKKLLCYCMDISFVAEHKNERLFSIPLLFLIIGLFAWGATLWLIIIGLFFGLRYHFEGAKTFMVDVNDAMDKVADAAENIKRDFTQDKSDAE